MNAVVKYFNFSGMNTEKKDLHVHTFKPQNDFKRVPFLSKVFKSSGLL